MVWKDLIFFSFADIPCTLQIKAIKARSLKNAFNSPNLAWFMLTHFPFNYPQNTTTTKEDTDTSLARTSSHISINKDHKFSKNNEKEEEKENTHVHTINSKRTLGSWSKSLIFNDLPSIAPLHKANIILSLNVSIFKFNKSKFNDWCRRYYLN